MKLCIVTPSFVGGGAERIAVNLANYYTTQGVDVSLLVFKGIGPYADQVNGDVRLIDLQVSRSRYVFFRLWNALHKEQPTHVLSVIRGSNIILGLLAWFSKSYKLIFREASTMNAITSLPQIRRLCFFIFIKLTYRKANIIIANSVDTKKDLVNNQLVHQNKIDVIGNPVLPADFEFKMSKPLPHCWFLDPDVKVILTVGRLHKLKNQALLIRAFSNIVGKHNDLRLVILGSGEEQNNLLELAEKLGVSDVVEIIPFQENPYPYYKNAHLFVLTSDWEGFGNVLVEAMACGTQVVSTDCPGGPKTILKDGQFGVLFPVGDEEALTNILFKHFENKEALSINDAVYHAKQFSVTYIAEKYLKILHRS